MRSATASVTFSAVADAWVEEAVPGANHGSRTPLHIKASPKAKIAYLRFNVTGLASAVERATLQVFAKTSNASGHEVRPVAANDWGETTITYANAPPRGAVLATAGPVTTGQWSSVDVTAAVQGNRSVSLALTGTSGTVTRYASREVGAKAPRLVVETPVTTTTASTVPPPPGDPVLAAAGDIACDPFDPAFNGGDGTASRCRMKATSDLLTALEPTAVAALGDNQYKGGTLEQFNTSFHLSWGRLKDVIHPAIGNHEIRGDRNAAGYYSYFGAAAGDPTKGYYSYDVGAWHVVVLNGNCKRVPCMAGSLQEQWLVADLAANPAACTLAYWHQPRFSSGTHGSDPAYTPFWQALYNAGADVVLNGHDHHYERFAPQNPGGVLDEEGGIREFVVGTGGAKLEGTGTVQANSQIRTQTYGVLKLTLQEGSYDWDFLPVAGESFSDKGYDNCHN